MSPEQDDKKETVLFVHGAWHGKWCWEKYFVKKFTEHGYNVVTFDLPGHSESGKIKGINKYTLTDYVNAIKNEVSKLKEPPIIIAHSMGGFVLQQYLETESCKKAIFLASIPSYGVIKATLNLAKKSYFYPSLLTFNLYGLVNTKSKAKHLFFSENLPDTELEEYTSKLCSESFIAFLSMLVPRFKVPENYQIPTLVLGAKNDNIFSVRDNEITAKKYNADLVILDHMGHDMMLDVNHEETSDQIITWLEKQ